MAGGGNVLILGSAPSASRAARWPKAPFSAIVAINNAWRLRPDWDFLIHPEDFPPERQPRRLRPGQRIVTADDYVPAQNALGGVVYAGGTMAFTAGYWALRALRPQVLAFYGCDMVYPQGARTHFYGSGAADPLRDDITLRSLEAKSARLMLYGARQGCRVVRLSRGESRLLFPSVARRSPGAVPLPDPAPMQAPRDAERALGYMVPSGRYWEHASRFDPARIDAIDRQWCAALDEAVARAR